MNDKGLKIKISLVTDELKKGIDNAKKQVSSFKEQVEKASKNVDSNFKSIGQATTSALKGVGVAVGAAAASLVALGASTTEYRQNQAQLNAAFEQAKLSTNSAKGAYNELFKVIGDSDQAVESAGSIAQLAKSEEEVANGVN